MLRDWSTYRMRRNTARRAEARKRENLGKGSGIFSMLINT